jgi:hypothetical protein
VKHQTLLELRVSHDGYPAGRCAHARIEPRAWEPNGTRALERHRLLVKPRPDGLDVLGRVDDRGRPFLAFDDLTLSFDLLADDGEILLRTDLAPLRRLAAPTFRRARSGSDLKLREGETTLPAGVLAGIEIAGVSASWLRSARRFVVPLAARQALWVYYLLTERRGEPPRIVDSDGQRGLQFAGEPLTDATALAESDPVGADLLSRHGSRTCYRLTSDRPLASVRAPLRGLTLHRGDQLLIADLPSPPIRNHATIALTAGSKPRDALYSVLEY